MDKHCDILIPELGGRIGSLVKDSLSAKGLVCEMMDDSKITTDELSYVRVLKRKIEDCHPKEIIPIFRSEIIAHYRQEFPKDIVIPIDSFENIHTLDNKVCACSLCNELGIPQPRMYSDDEIGLIKDYPVVFKRPEGLSGSGVYFPKSEKALSNLILKCGKKGHLVMDYIDGYDICLDAVRWEGYFHAECYKVILPKQKGISILRKSISRPDLVEYAKKILDSIDYKGVCGMDFRYDRKSGKTFFLECNPRFSGGLLSQLNGGFDVPYILYQLSNGITPQKFNFKRGKYSFERGDIIKILKYLAHFHTRY